MMFVELHTYLLSVNFYIPAFLRLETQKYKSQKKRAQHKLINPLAFKLCGLSQSLDIGDDRLGLFHLQAD